MLCKLAIISEILPDYGPHNCSDIKNTDPLEARNKERSGFAGFQRPLCSGATARWITRSLRNGPQPTPLFSLSINLSFPFEKVVAVNHVTSSPLPRVSEKTLFIFGVTDQNQQLGQNESTFVLKSVDIIKIVSASRAI